MAFARAPVTAQPRCATAIRTPRSRRAGLRCAAEPTKAGKSGASKEEAPYPSKKPTERSSPSKASSDGATKASSDAGPKAPVAQNPNSSAAKTPTGDKPKPQKVEPDPPQTPARAKSAAIAESSSSGKTNVERMSIIDGYFRDDRWINGTWDFQQFAKADGTTDWDLVIDAEMERRKILEETPIPSRNDDPVNFDTNMVPWWAWVKRFHLPEAEKLNGRAAMVGYLLAGLVDLASGAGLVEQQESFFGKLLLHLVVFAILLIRSTDDVAKYKNLFDEATFYDKQWNATWEGQVRPSEQEKSQ